MKTTKFNIVSAVFETSLFIVKFPPKLNHWLSLHESHPTVSKTPLCKQYNIL